MSAIGTAHTVGRSRTARLTLAALGVVFGDIGTSPLYTVKECFSEFTGLQPVHEDVLGQHDEALKSFQQALGLEEQLLKESPHDLYVQHFLANHLQSIGMVYERTNQRAKAIDCWQRALGMAREQPNIRRSRGALFTRLLRTFAAEAGVEL